MLFVELLMNKKGQEDIGKILGAIFGIFILFIFVIIIINTFATVNNSITQDQCRPIQEQLGNCQIQLNSTLIAVNQTEGLLDQCNRDYGELENNTITRKDFEEIKGYFDLTKNEINSINNKISEVNRVYNFYTIKNYSFALNIVLGIEIISLLFFKNEVFLIIINWVKRKRKKKQKKEEPKE